MKVSVIATPKDSKLTPVLYNRISKCILLRIAELEHDIANLNFHLTHAKRDLASLEVEKQNTFCRG